MTNRWIARDIVSKQSGYRGRENKTCFQLDHLQVELLMVKRRKLFQMPLEVKSLELEGVTLFRPRKFVDTRGYFIETFNAKSYGRRASTPLLSKTISLCRENWGQSGVFISNGAGSPGEIGARAARLDLRRGCRFAPR